MTAAPRLRSGAESVTHYLVCGVDSALFAIDVRQVREILEVGPMTAVPNAPDGVRGILDVRGKGVTVVDLRCRFGLPETADTVRTRIMVLEVAVDGETCVVGGLADTVQDVVTLRAADIAPPPRLSTTARDSDGRPPVVTGVARRDDRFLLVLDLSRVFSADVRTLELPVPLESRA